jgi:hypothetical protein
LITPCLFIFFSTAVTAPTCSQIESSGVGAQALSQEQVEAMTPEAVWNCLTPLGSKPIPLYSVAVSIVNKVKIVRTSITIDNL